MTKFCLLALAYICKELNWSYSEANRSGGCWTFLYGMKDVLTQI